MGVSLCHKMMCCICSVSGLHFLYIYYFFYCCFLCSLCGSGCLLSFWLSSVVHWWACLATEGSEVWLSWSIMSNSIHRSGCHGPFSSIHVWLPWSVMSSYIHEITQYSSPLSLYVYNLALLCVRMSVRDSMARDSTLLPLHRACTEGGFIPLLGCCEAAEYRSYWLPVVSVPFHKSVSYFLQVHCLPTCIVLLWLNHVVVWFLFRDKRILLPHWLQVLEVVHVLVSLCGCVVVL